MLLIFFLLITWAELSQGNDYLSSSRAREYLEDVIAYSDSIAGDSIRATMSIENPIWTSSDNYESVFEDFEGLVDCADFYVPAFLRLLYAPEGAYDKDLRATIKSTLLGWQFWPDIDASGGIGTMHIWTENHQINFHIAEYLVGALYPDDTFTRTGKTGAAHAKLGKARTLSWLDRRYRWGFSEWRSDVYSRFVVDATATLAALAPDRRVAGRAEVVLDLLLLDSALHSFRGKVASSRGRSYGNVDAVANGPTSTEVLNWLIGGGGTSDGTGSERSVASVAVLVTLPNRSGLSQYEISEVIQAIAGEVDQMQEFEARETIGIGPEDAGLARNAGLGLNRPADAFAWMGMGCYLHPLVVPLIVKAGNAYGLFSSSGDNTSVFDAWNFLSDMNPRDIRNILESKVPMTYYGSLGPAETTYWRSPNVSIASVTDFRKGAVGDQQRVWQATMSNGAAIFTTYPGPGNVAQSGMLQAWLSGSSSNGGGGDDDGDSNNSDYSAGYWTGSASLPRIGQWKNKLLVLYRPPPDFYGTIQSALFPYGYTHASFPLEYFDEVYDDLKYTGRIAGRIGDGFVALFSASSAGWIDDQEIYSATGVYGTGAWACVVGDVATHGSFSSFVTYVQGTTFEVSDYASMDTTLSFPDEESFSFGWDSPFVRTDARGKRKKVALSGYGRFDNAFVSAKFPTTGHIKIRFEGLVHVLNFKAGTRVTQSAGINIIAVFFSGFLLIGISFILRRRYPDLNGGLHDFFHKLCHPEGKIKLLNR